MRPARFLSAAREELLEAQAYYNWAWQGLGDDFVAEVERVVRLLCERPELGPLASARSRRFSLRRFPYTVIYRVLSEELLVVAVAHQRRRPGYWRRRS